MGSLLFEIKLKENYECAKLEPTRIQADTKKIKNCIIEGRWKVLQVKTTTKLRCRGILINFVIN